jgi:hypothetical protein
VRDVEFSAVLPVLWTLDFNVAPLCSLVVQKYRDEVRVLDEIVLRRATTEQACEEFERKFGMPRAGVVVFGDANGLTTHTASELTDFKVIHDYFSARGTKARLNVPRSNPSVRARVGLVNSRLCNAEGDVNLIVSPRCKELIDDFEQVVYEEESTQIDKNKDRRRTHASDALGYLVWQECQVGVNTIGERGQRLI